MKGQSSEENLKALYDEAYAMKLLAKEESRRIRPILERINLPADAKVLDVGCGNGPLAGLLASGIGEYHGVDFSEAFIQQARRIANDLGILNCQFHVSDVVEYIDENEGQFDVVFALDISEHIPDAEWSSIVASFKRALKPGGQVIAHTPNLDFFVERMKDRGVLLKQFPEHVAVRTADQNAKFFNDAGLASVRVRYLPHYNILKCLHPLSKIPWLGRFFAARLLLTATRDQ